MLALLLDSIGLVFIYMTVIFIIAQIIKNNSIVDIGWGLGFALISVYTLYLGGNFNPRSVLVTILVLIWGIRLSYHILKRNLGKSEDFRYAKWRKEWGKWRYVRAFFQIFILQGIIMLIVAYPIILNNNTSTGDIGVIEVFGLVIWILGFSFEVIGDKQLRDFIANNRNKGHIMREGLWKYTRHPNYFGEATLWLGIYIISITSKSGVFGIVSPITITLLLLFVSGIPLLEKHYENNKEYQEYAQVTNMFFPWFQKKTRE